MLAGEQTEVVSVDPVSPEPARIEAASAVLRRRGLVAFPTETVYGLGAQATDPIGVLRIFEAKERPANKALIVHVSGVRLARRFAASFTPQAELLAARFWPGPLSIVLPRAAIVPKEVCGGGETVAMRAPQHPVALALIEALDDGIAAPSANRASRLPPQRAGHVLKGLGGRIEMVLDAGPCPGGLESTVVDLTGERARIVRRGAITLEQLREHVDVDDMVADTRMIGGSWVRFAPAAQLMERAVSDARLGEVGVLLMRAHAPAPPIEARVLGDDAQEYASRMYDVLQELEDGGCWVVWAEELPEGGGWDAIRDRLMKLGTGG